MLSIKNLHVRLADEQREILKGLTLAACGEGRVSCLPVPD